LVQFLLLLLRLAVVLGPLGLFAAFELPQFLFLPSLDLFPHGLLEPILSPESRHQRLRSKR